MIDILRTLMISCVPAIVTGLFAFFTARKNANAKIQEIQKQNEHEINKLMEQHKIDIESLKEKHALEMESENAEHQHKIEIIEIKHKNELTRKEKELESTAMYGAMGELFSNPEKIQDLLKLMSTPGFQKFQK